MNLKQFEVNLTMKSHFDRILNVRTRDKRLSLPRINKAKPRQQDAERNSRINTDNKRLFNQIQNIVAKSATSKPVRAQIAPRNPSRAPSARSNKSTVSTPRSNSKQNRQLQQENERILKRMQTTPRSYDTVKWTNEERKRQQLIKNLKKPLIQTPFTPP